MSAIAPACVCGSIGAPQELRRCDECHRYWLGDRELPSVNQIVRAAWPIAKNFDAAPPDVLEHARERGVRVDKYFSDWINGGKQPFRTNEDEWIEVIDRTRELCEWWEDTFDAGSMESAKAQVMMTDGEIAGTADIITRELMTCVDGSHPDTVETTVETFVYDIKSVWALDPTYQITAAAYMDLAGAKHGGLIHQTKKGIKLVPIDGYAIEDWRLTRDFYFMCQRRAK